MEIMYGATDEEESEDEEHEDDEDEDPTISAIARLDIIVAVSEVESNSLFYLLNIKSRVFLTGRTGQGVCPRGRESLGEMAFILGDKAENTWLRPGHDSTAIVGLKLKWEEMEKCATDEILDVGLFFEECAEIFLLTFLAVTEAGLAIRGF